MDKGQCKKDILKNDYKTFKWAISMAWDIDKSSMFFWAFVGILGSLMPVFFIKVTQKTIDTINVSIENQSSFSVILIWIGTLILFLFLNAVYDIVPNVLRFTMHSTYSVGMQKKVGEWIQTLPLKLFDDPDMITRMNMTMPTIKRLGFFLQHGINFISSFMGIISILILAFSTSSILFIMGFLLLAISLPIGFYNAKSSYKLWWDEGDNNRLEEYYYGLVFDTTLAKEYRMLNLDKLIRQKWTNIANPMKQRKIHTLDSIETRWNLLAFVNLIFKFVILLIGLKMTGNNNLTIGGLVLFVSVFDQLSSGSTKLGREFTETYGYFKYLEFQRDLLSLDFSNEYPKYQEDNESKTTYDNETTVPIQFELRNVSYSYNKNKDVLNNVSMKIHEGEIVALVGNNGAGKSTLIKLLLGFYTPTKGEMYFMGKNYKEVDTRNLVSKMGVTFQDFAKFEFTIRENIAFGDISKIDDDVALLEAANKGGVDKVLQRVNGNLDTSIGKWYDNKGTNFSGGEWQRIAASRAYISDRNILIMDEPSSALDPIAELEQFNNIRSSLHNRTAILISHRIGFARLADKIAVLSNGELVEFGNHNELMELGGVYYDMFTSQAKWYDQTEEK